MKADAKPPEPGKPAPAAAEDATSEKPAAEPAKLARASRLKPVETVSPENDPLLKLAQKYIHGHGVRADCVTGMAYLRQAMKRPNYAAASQMGALYATGTCVPLDRVEAYRYFSSAMQMAPSNPYLGQERDKLYGQMTSAERRQADQQQ
jgi:TPR repeat protein